MTVTVTKTIEAASYEEAEHKAKMLIPPNPWARDEDTWETNVFGNEAPTINDNELYVTAIGDD